MIKIYFTPFNDDGTFGQEVDITQHVDFTSIGKIKRSLSNSVYDIGILRYDNLTLKLHNDQGLFSDVDNLRSMFRFRRSGAKVRVTWAPAEPAICGIAVCGETILSEEVTIFAGILNDEASVMNIDDQIIQFVVLSYDSQFSKVVVPFTEITGGDTMGDIVLKILNQAAITKYVSVDEDEIQLEDDFTPDDISWFEDKTGQEAIEAIMLISNSVIFIEDNIVKVRPRTASDDVKFTFYGQASAIGNENINMIDDFRNGQNRVINFVRWKDGAAIRAPASMEKWGVSLKEIDSEFITNSAKQTTAGTNITNEFADPKREMKVETNLTADTVGLKYLDKVDMDYPSVVDSAGELLPIIGLTAIGDVQAPLPHILWDFQMNQDRKFKIMGMDIDLKKETINFDLREI